MEDNSYSDAIKYLIIFSDNAYSTSEKDAWKKEHSYDVDNALYAAFLTRCHRVPCNSTEPYYATLRFSPSGNPYIQVNSYMWDQLSIAQKAMVLKHEAIHYLHAHTERIRSLIDIKKYKNKDVLISADFAVNSFIDKEPWKNATEHKLYFPDDYGFDERLAFEDYLRLVKDKQLVPDGFGDSDSPAVSGEGTGGSGGSGGQSEADDFLDYSHQFLSDWDSMTEQERELAESKLVSDIEKSVADAKEISKPFADRYAGTMPSGVMEAITMMTQKRRMSWQRILRALCRRKANSKARNFRVKTRMREGRRGVDTDGNRRKKGSSVVFAIDTSGSMPTSFFSDYIFPELRWVQKIIPNVWYVECDADVYGLKKLSRVSKEVVIEGRGGTVFSPLFDLISQHAGNIDALIVFTDGGIFDLKDLKEPIGVSVLWVLMEQKGYAYQYTFDPPFGEVTRMDTSI